MTETYLANAAPTPPAAPEKPTPKGPTPVKSKAKAKPKAKAPAQPAAQRRPMSGVELPPPAPEKAADEGPQLGARQPLWRKGRKLDAPKREGFVRRWINDTPGRIQDAQGGGYAIVKKDGKPWTTVVGVREGGGSLVAYLMEIPQQFYDQDFAAKQEKRNELERQIYTGTHKQEAGDNRYVPKDGIKVGVQRGNT